MMGYGNWSGYGMTGLGWGILVTIVWLVDFYQSVSAGNLALKTNK